MRMNKRWAFLIVLAIYLFVSLPVHADTQPAVKIMVNNRMLPSNVSAVNDGGVVLVPAKEYLESLGGTFAYEHSLTQGTARAGENELVFRLDDRTVRYDGKYVSSPAPMKILNYRFMIPAEFAGSRLGTENYMDTRRNTLMIFQPVNGEIVYQVLSGDSLWGISQTFGVPISTLRQLNNLTGDMLYVGQKLVIKNAAPFFVSFPAYATGSATLRSGPGFGFSPLGYLSASTGITVVGKNGDWYKVTTPKGSGYMYYSVVGMTQELAFSTQKSGYFSGKISSDTSRNTVSYLDYTVQRGDNMWAISQKYGIPDYELAAANSMTAATTLYPGQKIRIPVHNIPVKPVLGSGSGEILDWFTEAQYVFPAGKAARLIEPVTGRSFHIKRTMGASHADSETLTVQDTQIMKEIFGGTWNWNRKPMILELDGRRFAVSVAGMPHAGVDGVPYMQTVANRSDNYGTGPNYDAISGNGMGGHFDLYFLNGLRHKDNQIDPSHQYFVLKSGGLQ